MACLVENRVEFTGFPVEAISFANSEREEKERRRTVPDEHLIKMIMESHGKRMEDQRTRMPFTDQEELFMDLVGILQSRRMDDQRASLVQLPSSTSHSSLAEDAKDKREPELVTEEEFVELLFRCQSCRINDQRSPDPETYRRNIMPGEDFFNLLQHLQSTRIEDQRSPFPSVS